MASRVLIVEDHALVREALRSLVAGMHDFTVAGVACDGKQAVRAAVALQPDLVLMDLSMPGLSGFDAIAEIRRRLPGARVVVLTLSGSEDSVHEAFRVGAHGYLSKGTALEEFEFALNSVMAGKKYISNELSSEIAAGLLLGNRAVAGRPAGENLTARERSILKLVAEGNTNREAAEFLCISPKTVEKHRASLMHKLGLRTAAELVITAAEMGLVERPAARRRPPAPAPDSARPNEFGQFC
jgi:DNA-binding NarL/FixJ family response regulator